MKQVEERYIKAEIAKFTPQEMREYETSKMAYRDIKNSVDTAKREGIAEGMEKRSLEIARKMLAKGIDEATVKEITGLSAEHILQLKAEILLNFRMWFKYGLKAQKLLAQGIALGIIAISKAPCKGKSLMFCLEF